MQPSIYNPVFSYSQQFRLAKDWAGADALKQELLSKGIEVKDTPTGPVWRKL